MLGITEITMNWVFSNWRNVNFVYAHIFSTVYSNEVYYQSQQRRKCIIYVEKNLGFILRISKQR